MKSHAAKQSADTATISQDHPISLKLSQGRSHSCGDLEPLSDRLSNICSAAISVSHLEGEWQADSW